MTIEDVLLEQYGKLSSDELRAEQQRLTAELHRLLNLQSDTRRELPDEPGDVQHFADLLASSPTEGSFESRYSAATSEVGNITLSIGNLTYMLRVLGSVLAAKSAVTTPDPSGTPTPEAGSDNHLEGDDEMGRLDFDPSADALRGDPPQGSSPGDEVTEFSPPTAIGDLTLTVGDGDVVVPRNPSGEGSPSVGGQAPIGAVNVIGEVTVSPNALQPAGTDGPSEGVEFRYASIDSPYGAGPSAGPEADGTGWSSGRRRLAIATGIAVVAAGIAVAIALGTGGGGPTTQPTSGGPTGATGPSSSSGSGAPATQTPPTITSQPQSQTCTSGGSVSVVVADSGTPPLTIQWQESTDGGATFTPVAGATAPSWGQGCPSAPTLFRAVVSNAYGSTTSATASVVPSSGG